MAECEIRRLEAEVTADFDNQTVDEDLTLESRSTAS